MCSNVPLERAYTCLLLFQAITFSHDKLRGRKILSQHSQGHSQVCTRESQNNCQHHPLSVNLLGYVKYYLLYRVSALDVSHGSCSTGVSLILFPHWNNDWWQSVKSPPMQKLRLTWEGTHIQPCKGCRRLKLPFFWLWRDLDCIYGLLNP